MLLSPPQSVRPSFCIFCRSVVLPVLVLLLLAPWATIINRTLAVEESHLVSVRNLTDNALVHPVDASIFVPLFWHIAKSGGTTMKAFVDCLGLVSASEVGRTYQSDHLAIVQVKTRMADGTFANILNVDVSTQEGLEHARTIGLVTQNSSSSSTMVDVILSPKVHEASQLLFSTNKPAQLLALFRHPVDRAVSMFYYVQKASWERSYRPELQNTTLLEFYEKAVTGAKGVERNWVTRALVGKMQGPLTEQDIQHAKQIVSDHMLVGFTQDLPEAFRRFGIWTGWNKLASWGACVQSMTTNGMNVHKHPNYSPDSREYKLILAVNRVDMELYQHVQKVFEEQSALFDEEVIRVDPKQEEQLSVKKNLPPSRKLITGQHAADPTMASSIKNQIGDREQNQYSAIPPPISHPLEDELARSFRETSSGVSVVEVSIGVTTLILLVGFICSWKLVKVQSVRRTILLLLFGDVVKRRRGAP